MSGPRVAERAAGAPTAKATAPPTGRPSAGADQTAPTVDAPPILRLSSWSMVRAVVVVGVGLVTLRVVLAAGTVLWWLAIGTVVAAIFQPAVRTLGRYLPSWVAMLVVVVGVMGLLGLVGYRGFAELSAQFDTLRDNALAAARDIQGSRQFGQVAGEFGLVPKTTRFFEDLPVVLGGQGGEGGTAATVQTAASSGSALFAIATFTVLMLIFGSRFAHAALAQVDDPIVRGRVSRLVIRSYHQATRYTWLMAARAVVVGVVGGLSCRAMGLETPTVLGVGFAVLSVIPGVGILLAALPIAVFTGITSVPTGLLVLCTATLVQAVEVAVVQRRIDSASVAVGPAPTLIAAILGLQLYGLGGLLVGLAVAVFGLAILRNLTMFHDEVFTAVRELVTDDVAVTASGTVMAGDGAEVVATAGAEVLATAGAEVTAGAGTEVHAGRGADVVVGDRSTVVVDPGTEVIVGDAGPDGDAGSDGDPAPAGGGATGP